MKQYTYMMLKPDAFENNVDKEVIQTLENHGLHVEKSSRIQVTLDVMKTLIEHYQEVIDTKGQAIHFPGKLFNTFYYQGPHFIMPMKVSYEGDEDIITYSRKLVGKTNPASADKESIRGHFSQDSYEKADKQDRLVHNVIHASDSFESAQRELHIWEKYLKV